MTASHIRYRPAPTVTAQDLGDRILLTPLGGAYLVLEGTAATLWRLLDQPRSVDELADECARRYDGVPEQIRIDIADTMNEWSERGLVRTAGSAPETAEKTAGSK
ncbi:PqqD family protein [Nocardia transvalensis]|uniref:PqqD family protein n=1 Tax=Nocardia transvalensis TaxID=37333 RepID=UPI00189636AC|nr:PqqD family protein [Nocardia transvalensis]MBF6328296.1 PqqD family protein [Nocardia transvalensis]